MPTAWDLPAVTDDEIQEVERAVLHAFSTRSTADLTIFGLGELGIALGWPTTNPTAVFKRHAPGPDDQLAADMSRMHQFHGALVEAGAPVLPTDIRIITNQHGVQIPYLIQPIVQRNELVENLLADADPSPEHPLLVSLRDTVAKVVHDDVTGGLSIDAQVTNFAWNGEQVVSIDTTPPLIWGPDGGPMYDTGNYLTAVPAVLRPVALALTRKTGDEYRTLRSVLEMTTTFLLRIDQERWVDSAIICFNEILDTPLARADVDKRYKQVIRDLPMIKRLARIQRFWATRVRKQRYEFFITNSFTGEIY